MDNKAVTSAKKYMLRSCGKGNECACQKAKRVLASEVISIHAGSMVTFKGMGNDEHVNKLPFKGILLLTDVASTKPPHGSRGHRIFVPKSAVEGKLSGLVGMGVNYDAKDLDSHVTRHKVGVIEKAWTKGNQVWVSGFVWKKDFPEAVKDLKTGGLGMSMELADVFVRDDKEDVWHLEDFEFTGATILKKTAAAYYGTELVASSGIKEKILTLAAAAVGGRNRKGDGMEKKQKKPISAAASDTGQGALLVGAIEGSIAKALAPITQEIKASNDRSSKLESDLEELKGLFMIQAAAQETEDEEDEELELSAAGHEDEEDDEDSEMSAAKHHDDEDDDDDDDGEDDDLDAMEDLEKEAADQEPGEVNKDAKNKGDKNTVEHDDTQREKVSGNIAKGRLSSAASKKRPFPGLKSSASIQAAAVHINTLTAQIGQLKKENRKLVTVLKAQNSDFRKQMKKISGKYSALEAQAERFSEQIERKSVIPVDVRNLAAKNNVNLFDVQASGEKLPVETVDQWFRVAESQGIQIEPSRRAGMKTQLYQMGLMESGEIPFGGVN